MNHRRFSGFNIFPDGHSGFEDRIAYLLSRDGQRVLYPYSVPSEGLYSKSRSGRVTLLYADQEITCEIEARPDAQGWRINTRVPAFGRRHPTLAPELARIVVESHLSPAPNRALYLRIQWAIFDGWLSWGGTRAVHRRWIGRLKLHKPAFVSIADGYRGGVFLRTAAAVHAHATSTQS